MGHSVRKVASGLNFAARRLGGRGSAGFSLAEALIAIAIAAILAVAVTRLANNTRMSAGNVQELVNMMNLNGTLLAQIAPKEMGTTHGRTARLAWHVAVAPLRFTAIASQVAKEEDANAGSKPVAGLVMEGPTQNKKQEPPAAAKWLPVYVTVTVDAPSGRRYSVDTISMAPAPTENEPRR